MSKPRLTHGIGTPEKLRECGFAPMAESVAQLRRMVETMEKKVKDADKGVWLKWHVQMYYGYEKEETAPPISRSGL